jgi:hypothetical protein
MNSVPQQDRNQQHQRQHQHQHQHQTEKEKEQIYPIKNKKRKFSQRSEETEQILQERATCLQENQEISTNSTKYLFLLILSHVHFVQISYD